MSAIYEKGAGTPSQSGASVNAQSLADRGVASAGGGYGAQSSTLTPAAQPGYADQVAMMAPTVQAYGGGTTGSTENVQAAAAHGLSSGGGPLPFQDQIQAGFGRHDVSGIKSHVGGPAADATKAMGASAYASQGAVAFGQQPDLHTAAHEAAHVIQQQSGVALKGGVGAHNDTYERHADAVADSVVAGRSAEVLLDQMAPSVGAPRRVGSGGDAAVQMKWLKHAESRFLRWDRPEDGLRWYVDPREDEPVMFFEIEDATLRDEHTLSVLEAHAGRRSARTEAEWEETGYFEANPSEEAVEVGPSDEFLGPVTVSGVPITRVGFGTDGIGMVDGEMGSDKKVHDDRKAAFVAAQALQVGYTLFDTAYSYGTAGVLGSAIVENVRDPSDIFVVYKIRPKEVIASFGGDVGEAVEHACKTLNRDSLDCLMLHEPPSAEQLPEFMRQMTGLVKKGRVRYLGLSNASVDLIQVANKLAGGDVGISFVQNKMHPKRHDEETVEFCRKANITYMGYSIQGSGDQVGTCGEVISDEPLYNVREDGDMLSMAQKEGMTGPTQLALSWAVQRGTVQIPSSSDKGRATANKRAGYKRVTEHGMAKIGEMDDVITEDDQVKLLMREDPLMALKIKLLSKKHWSQLDALAEFGGMGVTLKAIAARIDDEPVFTAFTQLMTYVDFIDGGSCCSEAFVLELQTAIKPGDYSLIDAGLATGSAPAVLVQWWVNAKKSGGCARARTRVMGYIARGMDANMDEALDASAPQVQVLAGGQETVLKSALTDVDWDTAEPEEGMTARRNGVWIEFDLIAVRDVDADIRVTRTM